MCSRGVSWERYCLKACSGVKGPHSLPVTAPFNVPLVPRGPVESVEPLLEPVLSEPHSNRLALSLSPQAPGLLWTDQRCRLIQ